VPGPGDPDATGTASLRLNPGQDEICLDISWANIDGEVFAGHIHAGTATVAGPVVVTLFTGAFAGTDSVSGCVAADRTLMLDIIRNPENYYVNVHSRPNFPGGAVRGQLG
jgi:CHRD domain